MPDGLDYVMRPVMERLISYTNLKDGTISLLDIAVMHDALNAWAENAARIRKAQERNER